MKEEFLARATELARRPYRVVVMNDETTDGNLIFLAANPELPGCMAQGVTIAEATQELETARVDYIVSLIEDGLPVPIPQVSKVETTGSDIFEDTVQMEQPKADFLATLERVTRKTNRKELYQLVAER
jgi:predicted RNase H-like HicB family nuclease